MKGNGGRECRIEIMKRERMANSGERIDDWGKRDQIILSPDEVGNRPTDR